MVKSYMSVGIDHGTSNSSIAVMEDTGPRIIKVNSVDEIMPSVVYMSGRGRTDVGAAAYKAMWVNDLTEGDGHTGYKLQIGQNDLYEFTAAKKTMTAQQLGGLVMGALLKAYQEDTHGQPPKAAVITVPAKFEQSARMGTSEAARLAGLSYNQLLQEPIAAALAYGFTAAERRAQWMVFDLGGGTLDVSLVIVRNGQMVVPEEGHAGDNRLGGREFDREIIEYVRQELRKTYALQGFSKDNKAYSQAWGKLLIACEDAKIQLSTRREAVVEVDGALCKDERGKDVKVEVPLTRDMYEKMISAHVQKAVHICKTLLGMNRLAPRDLDRVILIGGPTKTPCIQQALADSLGVDVGISVNPMTAVAQGAAIYAATVELPQELSEPGIQVAMPVNVTLNYERASKLPTCFVAGAVDGLTAADAGATVEIRRTDGRWSSGMLPIDQDGMFSTDVGLIDEGSPRLSSFTTTVTDSAGRTLASVDEPKIWYPYPEGKGRLANSLRVAVKGNQTEVLVKQGVELPATGRERFVTLKALRKGSREDILSIPILEGRTHLFGVEDDQADCNVHVGTLTIKGDDKRLRYDLPQGSEIDVTLQGTGSSEIHCTAYVLLLDEEFEATVTRGVFAVSCDEISERFERLKLALEQSEKVQGQAPVADVGEKLAVIRNLKVVEDITKQLSRAKEGERDALYRAYTRVLELAGALNLIREIQTSARVRCRVRELKGLVENGEKKALSDIETELEQADRSGDGKALSRLEESLEEIDTEVRQRPYLEVLIDVMALENRRWPPHQVEVGNAAVALINTIEAKGGMAAMTDSDRAALVAAHRRMAEVFPELPQLRAEALSKIPGKTIRDIGGDIEKATPKTH